MTVVTKETVLTYAMLFGEEKYLIECMDCGGTGRRLVLLRYKACSQCLFGYGYMPAATRLSICDLMEAAGA